MFETKTTGIEEHNNRLMRGQMSRIKEPKFPPVHSCKGVVTKKNKLYLIHNCTMIFVSIHLTFGLTNLLLMFHCNFNIKNTEMIPLDA